MGEVDTGLTEEPRRLVAFVHGHWQVTYLCAAQVGRDAVVRSGLLTGPLVSDPAYPIIWVAVVPDGRRFRIMIRRDSITSIAPLQQSRRAR
jgi:hypothetical protein